MSYNFRITLVGRYAPQISLTQTGKDADLRSKEKIRSREILGSMGHLTRKTGEQ
jgi:hypothetical protein